MPSFRRAGLGLGVAGATVLVAVAGPAPVAPQLALFGALAEWSAIALVSHDTATHQ